MGSDVDDEWTFFELLKVGGTPPKSSPGDERGQEKGELWVR
ncbi:hypothetical protein [Thermococcus sp.]|nr:hypothetical protein [Thermococcus sp.]